MAKSPNGDTELFEIWAGISQGDTLSYYYLLLV